MPFSLDIVYKYWSRHSRFTLMLVVPSLGTAMGHICYDHELVVDGKIAPRFCAVHGGETPRVYRNHEPVAATVLSHDGNFSPILVHEEFLDQIVPPQVATLVKVVEVSCTILVVFSLSALPGEFELVVAQRLFVHDNVQLGEVGMDNGQSI